jgi:hypothetical protein
MVTQLWNPITPRNPEDGDDTFYKMSSQIVLHWTKSQKASIIDTTMKASQRTVFFDHKLYPSMERLINSVTMESW